MKIYGQDMGRATANISNAVEREQTVNVMGDGSVRCRAAGPATEFITFRLRRLDDTKWALLKALVASVLKFAETPVSVEDDLGVVRSCRYWGDSLRGECRLGRFWDAEITFRVEI